MTLKKHIRLHGVKRQYDDVLEAIEWARERVWYKEKWQPRLEPISEESIDELNDSEIHDYQEIGWLYDYCEICQWKLYESKDPERNEAFITGNVSFTDDDRWVCSKCYNKFLTKK